MTCRLCEERVATGSLCFLDDSDCFTVDGDGSELDPFTISPDISATAGNLITCGVDGLLASLPTIILNPPSCQVTRTGNQSIPNNTLTAISFNLEVYDTDTMHSNSTNPTRITFTTAGTYVVTTSLLWYKNSTGDRTARIRKNGTDTLVFEGKDAGGADLFDAHNLSCVEQFAAADYIEVLVQQTSGAALDMYAEHGAPAVSAIRRAT